MSFDPFPQRSSEPELVESVVKITNIATKVLGKTVTMVTGGTGIVNLTWKENPGFFVGCTGHCFEAAAPAALKGYTVVPGTYNTATFTLPIQIFNSTFTLTDLAAAQFLTLKLGFKYASQTGNAAT